MEYRVKFDKFELRIDDGFRQVNRTRILVDFDSRDRRVEGGVLRRGLAPIRFDGLTARPIYGRQGTVYRSNSGFHREDVLTFRPSASERRRAFKQTAEYTEDLAES